MLTFLLLLVYRLLWSLWIVQALIGVDRLRILSTLPKNVAASGLRVGQHKMFLNFITTLLL